MYVNVHFPGGKLVTVREVDVTTKAHQRHEGSPYSPFETTPQRRFSTTSGRPWGGLQTLTNFPEGNHNDRFLTKRFLLPRSLQPPRVTRSKEGNSRRAQIMICFSHKKEREKIFLLIGKTLRNSQESSRDLGFSV